MKKRLLFYVDQLSNGGAERVSSILINALVNSYQIAVIIFEKTEKEYFISDNIEKIYIIDHKDDETPIRFINWMRRIEKIRKKTEYFNPDVIVSMAKPVTNLYLVLAEAGIKRKLILSERSVPDRYPKSWIMRNIRDMTYWLADGVVFQSEEARGYFTKRIQRKGIVIENPLISDLPFADRRKNIKKIITACRLSEEKNLPMLLSAFGLFVKTHTQYVLEIYGDGPSKELLEDMVIHMQLRDKVRFCGFVNDIHEKMAEGGIFVLSSNFEGLSNSMIEAMAIGIPVICTDCPVGTAKKYIRTGENGMLIPCGDAIALYHALCEIDENTLLRERIMEESIKIRDTLDENKIVIKWNFFLNKIGE